MSINIKHPEDTLVPSGGTLSVSATGAFRVAAGTSAQRPSPTQPGMIRFNTVSNHLETFNTPMGWQQVAQGDITTSTTVSGGNGIKVTTNGTTGAVTIDISLSTTSVVSGNNYTKFSVDAYGRIIQAASASLSDLNPPTTSINFNNQVLNNVGFPQVWNDAATKYYVDNVVTGLNWKQAVQAATVTSISLSGLQTVDGISLASGARILVKDQVSAQFNGIYEVRSGDWVRSSDFDGAPGNEVTGGAAVFVLEGVTNATRGWLLVNPTVSATVGTDELEWTQFTGGNTITYTGGDGILVSGISIDLEGQALALHNLSTNGLITRTGAGTIAGRTISGTSGRITVTNGDGVGGNPTVDLNTTGVSAGSYNNITVDAYGRITAGNTINYLTNITTSALGSGVVYISLSGNEIQHKTLVGAGGIEISAGATTITISAKGLSGFLTEASADIKYAQLSSQNVFTQNQFLQKITPQLFLTDSNTVNTGRLIVEGISGKFYVQKLAPGYDLISDIEFLDTQFNFRFGQGTVGVSGVTVAIIDNSTTSAATVKTVITREKGDFRYVQNVTEQVLGTGEAIITTISGKSEIRHRSLVAGGIIQLSASPIEINISANALRTITTSAIGGGESPILSVSANATGTSSEIRFKTFVGGGNIDVTTFNNTIKVSASNIMGRYSNTFNATTDWGVASGGYYTIAITAANHGRGTTPLVQVYEQSGSDYDLVMPDRLRVTALGQVEIRVTETPDNRFAGRYLII